MIGRVVNLSSTLEAVPMPKVFKKNTAILLVIFTMVLITIWNAFLFNNIWTNNDQISLWVGMIPCFRPEIAYIMLVYITNGTVYKYINIS